MTKGQSCIAAWILVSCCALLSAQEASDTPDSSSPSTVRELPVHGVWMKRENGELVWVPNFTWERWRQAMDRLEATESRPPDYQIEDLRVKGSAEKRIAQLDVTLDVRVLPTSEDESGWTRVPLRMDDAVIRSFTQPMSAASALSRRGRATCLHVPLRWLGHP